MAKELLKAQDVRTREEIATYLRQLADKLESQGTITLTAGDQRVELDPPERCEFEVVVEQDRSLTGRNGETSLEVEMEWDDSSENVPRDLSIE